jgi:hypothetical protein
MTVIIECISWLIKVNDNNDAQWKPEIEIEGLYVHVFCVLLQQSLIFVCRVLRVLDLGCVNIRNHCPDFRISLFVAVTFNLLVFYE